MIGAELPLLSWPSAFGMAIGMLRLRRDDLLVLPSPLSMTSLLLGIPPSPTVYWNHRISEKFVRNLRAAITCG